jgi:hypothetical protein
MTSPYTFEQNVLISNNKSSSSSTTGSLILYGGLGVAENINIAGITNLTTLNSSGLITGNSGLTITGTSTLQSISGTNLSLSSNLSVSGNSLFNQITSTTSILNNTSVTSLTGTNATFSDYVSVSGLITGTNGLSITGTSSLSAVTLTTLSGTSGSFSGSVTSNTLTANNLTTGDLNLSGILTNNNTTDASAIGTASSIFSGGMSIAKQLMTGSKVFINYNGSILSSQLLIFPGINNGESSLLFNQSSPGFGSNWKIGHNINNTGSDTFSIFSETLNANVLSSDNTGYITIPGTVNSGSIVTGTINTTNISLGNVTVQSGGFSSTYSFTLPTSIGTSGQVLTSSGASNSAFTWTTPISYIQIIVPDFLTVSPNDLTANGTFTIDYSGVPLEVINGGTGTTTSTGSGSVALNNSPTFITPNIGSATGTSLSVSSNVTINNTNIQSLSGNSYNFNLPSSPGTTGQVLTSQGNSNNMTWSDQYSPTKIIFSGSNNVSSFTNITGLSYSSGGFEITVIVIVIATNNLSQLFKLTGLYSANALAGWYFSSQSVTGDNTGVTFNLTNMGQVQYTSNNYPGFVSLTINCYQIFNYN